MLVRGAVGHADLRTTMAYTHLARKHLRGLVEKPRLVNSEGDRDRYARLARNLAKPPSSAHLSLMTEISSRLSTALAERYKIEPHLGEGDAVGSPASRLPCSRRPTGTTRVPDATEPNTEGLLRQREVPWPSA